MSLDYVWIALFNDRGQALERSVLGFRRAGWIDHDQFFPAGVVRERNTHQAIAAVRGIRKRENLELEPMQFFKSQPLEQGSTSVGEIMLNRISQREEVAPCAFQSVSERDQFLPTVHADSPAVAQLARELFSVDVEIGYVGITPDERMKRFDLGYNRSIPIASVDLDCSGFTQLDRDDPLGRIRSKQEVIFLESH